MSKCVYGPSSKELFKFGVNVDFDFDIEVDVGINVAGDVGVEVSWSFVRMRAANTAVRAICDTQLTSAKLSVSVLGVN
jgi:hypothetical protein